MGEHGVCTERVRQVLGQALAAPDRLGGPAAGEALHLDCDAERKAQTGGREAQAVDRQLGQLERRATAGIGGQQPRQTPTNQDVALPTCTARRPAERGGEAVERQERMASRRRASSRLTA